MGHALADGSWGPAPGLNSTPARLPGTWGPVTITGDRVVETEDGFSYSVPLDARVSIVNAGRMVFVHVTIGGAAYVLAQGMQQLQGERILVRRGHP